MEAPTSFFIIFILLNVGIMIAIQVYNTIVSYRNRIRMSTMVVISISTIAGLFFLYNFGVLNISYNDDTGVQAVLPDKQNPVSVDDMNKIYDDYNKTINITKTQNINTFDLEIFDDNDILSTDLE